jgi:hypothetical protein
MPKWVTTLTVEHHRPPMRVCCRTPLGAPGTHLPVRTLGLH